MRRDIIFLKILTEDIFIRDIVTGNIITENRFNDLTNVIPWFSMLEPSKIYRKSLNMYFLGPFSYLAYYTPVKFHETTSS